MSSVRLDNLVLDYLRAQGYEKAAEGLRSHGITPALPEEGSQNSQDLQKKVVRELKAWAEHTDVEKSEGLRADTPFEAEARRVNNSPVQLGWLEDDLELECMQIIEQETVQQSAEVDAEAATPAKKQKNQEEESSGRKRRARTMAQPQIPLPAYSEEVKSMVLQSMRSRSHVSENALPCAAMYTFLNVPSHLNDSIVLYEGAKIAGAFGDSLIRVFDIKSNGSRYEHGSNTSEENGIPNNTQKTKILAGHTKSVQSLSWMDEDDLLLSGSLDGTVHLWNARLASALVVFKGHLFPIWDVDACPRGYYFASASMDKTARLWCTERLETIRLFAGHQESVEKIRWHPSCNLLATASADLTVRLWDVSSGSCVRLIPGLKSRITAMSFGPDAKTLFCGHENGDISSWDIGKPAKVGHCDGHHGPVWSLTFSRGNGDLLASGGEDDALKLWSLSSSQEMLKPVKSLLTRGTPVQSICWTHANFLVAAGSPRLLKSAAGHT